MKKLIELNEWQIEKLPFHEEVIKSATIQELIEASDEARKRLTCGLDSKLRKWMEKGELFNNEEKWSPWRPVSEERFNTHTYSDVGYGTKMIYSNVDVFLLQSRFERAWVYFCQSIVSPISNPWFIIHDGNTFEVDNWQELNLDSERNPGGLITEETARRIKLNCKKKPIQENQEPLHYLISTIL